jgi:hypothetical protein
MGSVGRFSKAYLVKKDGTFFRLNHGSSSFLSKLEEDWQAFIELPSDARIVILDALAEMDGGPRLLRYHEEPFGHFINELMVPDMQEGTDSSEDDVE